MSGEARGIAISNPIFVSNGIGPRERHRRASRALRDRRRGDTRGGRACAGCRRGGRRDGGRACALRRNLRGLCRYFCRLLGRERLGGFGLLGVDTGDDLACGVPQSSST